MTALRRRTLLQAAGLGATSWFLPSARRGRASPGASAPPRRVVFIGCELGWNPFELRMAPPGAPPEWLMASGYHPAYRDRADPRTWELDLRSAPRDAFSSTLAPLFELRDRALVLDGLSLASVAIDRYGDGHAKGQLHALTGHPAALGKSGSRSVAGAPSADQRIAAALRAQEPALTDLVSLELSLSRRLQYAAPYHARIYRETDQGLIAPVPAEARPERLYERLFSGGTAAGETPARRDLLSRLGDRYAAFSRDLSADDRAKLDLHRQLIRDAEVRLAELERARCQAPPPPEPTWPGGFDDGPRFPLEHFRQRKDAHFDLLTAALACGLTRVATIQIANDEHELLLGTTDDAFHEWYSHGTDAPWRWYGAPGANVSETEHGKFVEAAPGLAAKNRRQVEYAVDLARRLDEVPEGEGTLLDHTLIVLFEDISHGGHGHDQWPVVLLGGFGGAVRPGRYVRLPRTLQNPGLNGLGDFIGVPHSHLLVAILQGMGLDLDHLGVSEIPATSDRAAISLSGPLSALG